MAHAFLKTLKETLTTVFVDRDLLGLTVKVRVSSQHVPKEFESNLAKYSKRVLVVEAMCYNSAHFF